MTEISGNGPMVRAVPAISLARIVLAGTTLVRPDLTTRYLPGRIPPRVARALTRTLGAREMVLGVGTLAAARGGPASVRPWIIAQCYADSTDAVAFAAAAFVGGIPRGRGLALAAFALSGVISEVLTLRELDARRAR